MPLPAVKHEGERRYALAKMFYTLQGEGFHAGRSATFVRFAGCNLQCDTEPGERSPGGFICDTDFGHKLSLTADEIASYCSAMHDTNRFIVLTGGEPILQLDRPLLVAMRKKNCYIAVETNGTVPIPEYIQERLNWVTVSPKPTSKWPLKVGRCDELKYVIVDGEEPPDFPTISARRFYLSPAFDGDELSRANLDWAIKCCMENPLWRLSVQQHKVWGIP